MSNQKPGGYLGLGILASILIVLFVMGYSSLYDAGTYIGWVAFIWMTAVPAQIILGLHMHFMSPSALAGLKQPVKGLAYMGVTAVLMAVGGAFLYVLPGGSMAPGPFLIMATIMAVVLTFWLVGVWGCWPFTLMTANPFLQGLLAFVAAYALSYAAFCAFFNFGFLAGAPIYVEALDPRGMFGAWQALGFSVTTVAVIMSLSLFGFWPATLLAKAQPGLGLVVSVLVLVLSAVIFWLGLGLGHMDPVDYLVRVPVSMIFGVFLVTNMMQFQLFGSMAQPKRGFALLAVMLILAYGMQVLYRALIPVVVGHPLQAGAPTYEVELWVATALLSITFPVINLVSGYFGFWPLKRDG